MSAKNKPNEIHITRIYDAPVQMVWEAWNDPKQAAQWWGPRGFTITTHSKDLRAGGTWDYTMHGPDGIDYPNITKYFEVEKYSKLVYDHGGNKDQPPLFRVTADFTDLGGKKTQLDMTMAFSTPEVATDMKKFIKKAGGNGTWDRLAEYLEKGKSNKDVFIINQSFEAPIDLMFDVWTNPDHFSKWLPPTGLTMKFLRADIRPGGSTFYEMSDGAGFTMYGRAEYLEIVKPNRLVYMQQFCDENEKMARHPMVPTWPAKMFTTVTLTEEGANQTRVTINWEAYGDTTREELETFIQARAGMSQGWGGSFDKLEEYLARINKQTN